MEIMDIINVDLSEIKDKIGKSFTIQGQIDAKDDVAVKRFEIAKLNINQPISFNVTLICKRKQQIEVYGHLKTEVILECCRCLERFGYNIDKDFSVEYRAGEKEDKDSSMHSTEISKHELSIAYYSGKTLDLLDELCTQIVLAIPMKPLCEPECRGLCPQCGINLNIQKCSCKPMNIHPALAELEKFK
jgi:uncharacterized protein